MSVLQAAREEAELARAELASPEKTLSEVAGPQSTLPWFGRMTIDCLVETLCAHRIVKDVPQHVISFARLAEMAVSCTTLYNMFFMEYEPGKAEFSLWSMLMLWRMAENNEGVPVNQKLKFVRLFIEKHWQTRFPLPKFPAFDTYINWFGAGFCPRCTMYVGERMATYRDNDFILVAPFRLMDAEERAVASKEEMRFFTNEEPEDWTVAMQILQQKFPSFYCCINCGHRLATGKFGLPLSAIFDACLQRSSGNKKGHLWRELEMDIYRPDGTLLITTFNCCCRCGVLDIAKEQHEHEDDNIPTCPNCEEKAEDCECDKCESCRKSPIDCNCLICATCDRCRATSCSKRCKKNPCNCEDESESSSASSSSSDDTGFSESSSSESSDE